MNDQEFEKQIIEQAVSQAPPAKKRGKKPKAAVAVAAAPQPEAEQTAAATAPPPPPSCSICLSDYTAVRRKAIPCPSCSQEFCVECLKAYILTTTDDPHCMHCRHGFDRMFLQTNLSKLYMNGTYAEHRAQILWRREESYLPATQEKAERIVRGRKYDVEVIEPLRAYDAEIKRKIQKLHKKIEENQRAFNMHSQIKNTLLLGELPEAEAAIMFAADTSGRRTFTRKCTYDGCHGWLSSAWKCGLCENYTCRECFVIKGKAGAGAGADAHQCKKDDIDTAKLIRESSKPCPKCGEGIEKREGCDMMFCTSCHTPFSWKTLEIISRGSIHNPHYFEWRNRVGAGAVGGAHAAEPLPCGGMPPDTFIFRRIGNGNTEYAFNEMTRSQLGCRYRITSHMEQVTANQFTAHTRVVNTEHYRICYLLHEMTKEEIEVKLQLEERTRERHKAIRDVIDTYLVAAAEQLRVVAENPTEETATMVIESLDQLRDFINDCFRNVHKAYGCSVPFISTSWSDVESYSMTIERKRLKQEALEAADEKLVVMKETSDTILSKIRALRQEMNAIAITWRARGEYHQFHNDPTYNAIRSSVIRKETRYYTLLDKIRQRRNALVAAAAGAAAAADNY
jgi:hypothetical protein